MRKLIAVIFVAALGLSACGGGSNQASQTPEQDTKLSGRDVVLASLGKAEDTTARMDINYKIEGVEGQGEPMTFTGSGAFDMKTSNGTMTLKMPIQGTELNMEMLIVDQVYYFKYNLPGGQSLTPKPWLRASMDELAKMGGTSGVSQNATSNPADGLKIFATTGADVTEVGKEQVRGNDTTHYKVTLNPAELANSEDPAIREQAKQLQEVYGNNTVPADIWIDAEGRVAKVDMTIDMSAVKAPEAGQQLSSGKMIMSMEFYDYGTPVNVSAPPADQVTNFSEAMSAMGAASAGQ